MRKADVRDAQLIRFAPADNDLTGFVDGEFLKSVKQQFMGRPFVLGDMAILVISGSGLPARVIQTRPDNAPVRVTEGTEVQVAEERLPADGFYAHRAEALISREFISRLLWIGK